LSTPNPHFLRAHVGDVELQNVVPSKVLVGTVLAVQSCNKKDLYVLPMFDAVPAALPPADGLH